MQPHYTVSFNLIELKETQQTSCISAFWSKSKIKNSTMFLVQKIFWGSNFKCTMRGSVSKIQKLIFEKKVKDIQKKSDRSEFRGHFVKICTQFSSDKQCWARPTFSSRHRDVRHLLNLCGTAQPHLFLG